MAPSAHSTPSSPRLQLPDLTKADQLAYTVRLDDGAVYGEATLRRSSTRSDGAYELRAGYGRVRATRGQMGNLQRATAMALRDQAGRQLAELAELAGWTRHEIIYGAGPVYLWYGPELPHPSERAELAEQAHYYDEGDEGERDQAMASLATSWGAASVENWLDEIQVEAPAAPKGVAR